MFMLRFTNFITFVCNLLCELYKSYKHEYCKNKK